jgi:luciferase family oxidoreductase group 1
MTLHLYVLDQSPSSQGSTQDVAIRQSVELAQHCEALGYERYWVSEHHGTEAIVGSAPEILVAAIATATKRIRVGSAGVMLPHYAPLKVAEQFRVLEALAPGRIDLGLGRAPGGDGFTAYALNPNSDEAVQSFPAHVRDIIAWTSGKPLVDGHPLARIRVTPETPTAPEIFVLGSSTYGAQVGAYLGIPYSYAAFFADQPPDQPLEIYRRYYQPSERHPAPQPSVCLFVIAAPSTQEARFEFASRALARINRDMGVRKQLASPQVALDEMKARGLMDRYEQMAHDAIIGTGAEVRAKLEAYAKRYDLSRIVLTTHVFDLDARKRSFSEIARAFNLISA